ncbi:MAG: MFS transporter [Lachnospiraceae bacterium]|nr:MFS transporter [Lachnospiraceae bacterium]
MSSTVKKNEFALALVIGVIATELCQQASFIVLPALNSLSEYYSDVPFSQIQLITTLVYLGIVPFSIISGMVAGKYIKYKHLAILSCLIILAGGLFPVLVRDNFTLILASRFVCGIGQGLAYPLCNALITRTFKGDLQSKILGIGVVVLNLSGVFYQMVSGWVCDISVHYIWFVHLVLVIPIVLMIFLLKEPEDAVEEKDGQTVNVVSDKPHFSMRIIAICAGFGCWFIALYSVSLNMSSIIAYNEIGTSATAGMAGSANSVAGIVAGAVFAFLFRHLKKFVLPVGIAASVIGLGLCGYATNVPMVIISQFCVGFATFTVSTTIAHDFGAIVAPDGLTLANGILAAVWNFSAFLSTYFIAAITNITKSDNPATPVRMGMWVALIVGVIWTVFRLARPKELEP